MIGIEVYPVKTIDDKQPKLTLGEQCSEHLAVHCENSRGYLIDHLPTSCSLHITPIEKRLDAMLLAKLLEDELVGLWAETDMKTLNRLLEELYYHPLCKLLKKIREFNGTVITTADMQKMTGTP
jgi:hypothetical protein